MTIANVRTLTVALLLFCFGIASAKAGTPPVSAQGSVPSLATMLEKVLPGVVSISVKGHAPAEENPDPQLRRFFGLPDEQKPQLREFLATGSGVIVDPFKAYILTNTHVVENAEAITVTMSDGRHLQASLVGRDTGTDIAVLRVAAKNLSALQLGNSDQLKVGDYVVAVGNPFGLEQTVTSGIVSALGRSGLGIEGYESFIQTDASINPGNSGGALVNLKGELVGINSAIIGPTGSNIGISFAIPINMARAVMDQLIAHGEIRRGQLGVHLQDLTPELAKALNITANEGALVAQVIEKSPAEAAGIQVGDAITALDGQRVRNSTELRNRVGLSPLGRKVTIDIIRKGAGKRVVATLTEIQQVNIEIPDKIPLMAGVVLRPIERGTMLHHRLPGAVVVRVEKSSPSASAGLLEGDVIVGVNQKPARTPEDVISLATKSKDSILLQVLREGTMLFIAIG